MFPINARLMDGYILDKLTKPEKNNESTKKYFHYLSFFFLPSYVDFFLAQHFVTLVWKVLYLISEYKHVHLETTHSK